MHVMREVDEMMWWGENGRWRISGVEGLVVEIAPPISNRRIVLAVLVD